MLDDILLCDFENGCEIPLSFYIHVCAINHRSVGSTVVEMLKCHPPWYDYEPTAAMFKIVTEDTEPGLPPHCSEHVQHFLQMCFIK